MIIDEKRSDKMEKLKDVDMFLNDNYQILTILYEHEQEINNHIFTAITQQEIADTVGYSLMKTNTIINKLKQAGYVDSYKNTRGRYKLTNKAYCLIDGIMKIKGDEKNG